MNSKGYSAWKTIQHTPNSCEVAISAHKNSVCLELFSNLIIAQNEVVGFADQKSKKTRTKCVEISHFPLKNSWFALRATNEKAALAGDKLGFLNSMVDYYTQVRTYFEQNC